MKYFTGENILIYGTVLLHQHWQNKNLIKNIDSILSVLV